MQKPITHKITEFRFAGIRQFQYTDPHYNANSRIFFQQISRIGTSIRAVIAKSFQTTAL